MSISMPSLSASDSASRLVPTDGKTLPLEAIDLRVDAKGGLSRVVLSQRFRNPHAEPLTVTYKLPLPADAAVSGFVFRIGERTIRGKIEGRSDAREQFELAILAGKSAALLEEDRSSLFTQEIGNIPPGAQVVAEIEIDQPLVWLAEGSWEWRFPLAAAPRYLGAGPIEGNIGLDVASGELGARASLVLAVRDAIPERRSPESPSHPLVCSRGIDAFSVELGSQNQAPLDRDVVVRWPVATLEPGVSLDAARPASGAGEASAFGLLTLVPPAVEASPERVSRDLTLLLDTSGSMSGEPLEQAKRIACALVDSLGDADTLDLIEFSFEARAFLPAPERATAGLKKRAIAWVRDLRASGGTEMVTGVRESLRDVRAGSQRQVVMITDGLVGFERDVVRSILDKLPASARFHAVGVGSAVNRSLLLPVARAGRGIEAIVGLGEDAERAAKRLLSRTVAPILVDLTVDGSAVKRSSPSRLPDCFAGAPARIALELQPTGGEVVVRGRLGDAPFERRLVVPAVERGTGSEAVTKLYARERVEDVEMKLTAGVGSGHDQEIEALGKAFSIATRLTSFLAVTEEATVDPRSPSRREAQPQAIPYGMSAEGLGLRSGDSFAAERGLTISASLGEMRAAQAAAAPMGFGGFAGGPPAAPPPPPPGMVPPRTGIDVWAGRPRRESEEEGSTRGRAASGGRRQAAPPRAAQVDEQKKKSKGGGIFDKARRFVLGPPADEAPEALEAEAEAVRELAGRIVHASGDRVVVEIVVPEPGLELGFDGATVLVTLDDMTVIECTIDAQLSTREGSYTPGVLLRIALRLETIPGRPIGVVDIALPASDCVIVARA